MGVSAKSRQWRRNIFPRMHRLPFSLFRRSAPVVYALHTDWNLASAFPGQMIHRRKPVNYVVVCPEKINPACTLWTAFFSALIFFYNVKNKYISMIDVTRIGRLLIGTLHPTTFRTCSRSLEHRAMIITDTVTSSKNVVRCDHMTFYHMASLS